MNSIDERRYQLECMILLLATIASHYDMFPYILLCSLFFYLLASRKGDQSSNVIELWFNTYYEPVDA